MCSYFQFIQCNKIKSHRRSTYCNSMELLGVHGHRLPWFRLLCSFPLKSNANFAVSTCGGLFIEGFVACLWFICIKHFCSPNLSWARQWINFEEDPIATLDFFRLDGRLDGLCVDIHFETIAHFVTDLDIDFGFYHSHYNDCRSVRNVSMSSPPTPTSFSFSCSMLRLWLQFLCRRADFIPLPTDIVLMTSKS